MLRRVMASTFISLVNTADWFKMCAPVVVEGMLGRVDKAVCDARLEAWAKRVLERARVRLTVHGGEQLDRTRPAVLMSNHASFYDIPVVYATYGGNLRMVAKKELFGIPIIGQAMKESGMIAVDRGDRTQAVASLERGTQALVESGSSVWIAPEGTRTTNGALGAFKKGGFRLALAAGLPILPISLRGTRELLPSHNVRTRLDVPVTVTFHPFVETAPFKADAAVDPKVTVERLMQVVRERIESGLSTISFRALSDETATTVLYSGSS